MSARSILLAALAASALVPVAASAQSAGELRHDRREIRRDVSRGDWREAREDRQELREDWRDYRNAHHGDFRRPAYAGPAGYRYRSVGVGHRFAPAYYQQRYWLGDYARFRLPNPGYGRRWVRYGNDVVLIDLRSGRVGAVHRGFFW